MAKIFIHSKAKTYFCDTIFKRNSVLIISQVNKAPFTFIFPFCLFSQIEIFTISQCIWVYTRKKFFFILHWIKML